MLGIPHGRCKANFNILGNIGKYNAFLVYPLLNFLRGDIFLLDVRTNSEGVPRHRGCICP